MTQADDVLAETGAGVVDAPKRRINPVLMLGLMALPLVVVGLLGWVLVESNQGPLRSGLAPDFTLKTYHDAEITLSSHRGKVVILNFWASWCPPCRVEAPELNTLFDEYQAKGVMIVGIGYLDNERDAQRYLNEFGVRFPTGHDDQSIVSRKYRVKGVPETYIIDKNGMIRAMMVSNVTAARLRPILDELLAEPVKAEARN
jgi:cytochrome c biogenesis protein CcmG/thiol:disulfide interchange protein DsbE